MASTLFLSSAWKVSRLTRPCRSPCFRARYSTALLCKRVGQDYDCEERDYRMDKKTEVMVTEGSQDASGEGKASSKKSKAKRKSVKGRFDRGSLSGGVSHTQHEKTSTSVKSKPTQSMPKITKISRKDFVLFSTSESLPSLSELQQSTFTQETTVGTATLSGDTTASQSRDINSNSTQHGTVSEDHSLAVEGESVPLNMSILGNTSQDRDKSMQLLLEAGFSKSDAEVMFSYLPCCLEIDYNRAHKVVSVLMKHKLDWKHLLKWNALCFAAEPVHLDTNLQTLSHAGVKGWGCMPLLKRNPILFSSPLKKSVWHTLKKAKEARLGSLFVRVVLQKAMTGNVSKLTMRNDLRVLVSVLQQMQINAGWLLLKYPAWFEVDALVLQSLIEVMSSKPFYMDTSLIRLIIRRAPHIFVTIKSREELRAHLDSLHSVLIQHLTAKNAIRMFANVPSLISPLYNVEERLKVFKTLGFSLDDFCFMVLKVNTLLVQDVETIQSRLRLCLQLSGATPAKVAESARGLLRNIPPSKNSSSTDRTTVEDTSVEDTVYGTDLFGQDIFADVKGEENFLAIAVHKTSAKASRFKYLTIPVEEMQARVDFAKVHNAQLLTIERIHDLFGTSPSDFAKLFDFTEEDFLGAVKRFKTR